MKNECHPPPSDTAAGILPVVPAPRRHRHRRGAGAAPAGEKAPGGVPPPGAAAGPGKRAGEYYQGHTANYIFVKTKSKEDLCNRLTRIKVVGTENLNLIGNFQNII